MHCIDIVPGPTTSIAFGGEGIPLRAHPGARPCGFLGYMQQESRREISAFLVLGLAAFLWVCLTTYDPADSLGSVGPLRNACGPVGATVSFSTTTWFGLLGAYGLAMILAVAGLALLFRRSIQQLGWKVLGTALMILALSCFEVAVHEGGASPRTLPGGYYGQFFHGLLVSQVSTFGMYLTLALTAVVAFIISTDTILYPIFARAGHVMIDGNRWKSAAQALRDHIPSFQLPKFRLPVPWKGKEPGRTEAPQRTPAPSDGSKVKAAKPPEAPAAKEAPPPADGQTPAGLEARPPIKIREPEAQQTSSKKRLSQRGESGPYRLPSLDLLEKPSSVVTSLDRTILEQTASKIEETLKNFKIESRVVEIQRGPTITQYELTLAAGIKVHKIMNLSDDLAMALKAPSIRIVAPIPGKSTVGVEVPNKNRNTVCLREVIDSPQFRDEDYLLPLALGKDVAGTPVIGDLGDMPHLLIAGSTGSGKSICINSIITTLLLSRTPDEVKLILVDPKMVELAQFENIPHLLAPVVTDMKKAPAVLGWTVDKMEERYELLAMTGVRHITSYNALGREKLRERLKDRVDEADIDDFPEKLPFIVVIIDELADLMLMSSKEVETSITRLSQKSRAVGIHVILATQRPSVDVITGLIKANMSSRISFHVASKVDSRTILDRNGADKLLGKGDMLYLPPGTSALLRVQGTFISDKEIRDVLDCVTRQAEPEFNPELTRFGVEGVEGGNEEDELYEEAVRIVLGSQRGSVTLLQRQLQIGYTRASRLMELMHEQGLVGPFKGSKAREVYYTLEDWEQAQGRRKSQEGEGGGPDRAAADSEHEGEVATEE